MAYNPFDDVILNDPAYIQPPQKFFVGGAVMNIVKKLLKNASNDEVNQLRQFLTDSDQALKLKPGEYAPDYYAFQRDEPAYQYFEDLYSGGVGDLGDASAAQKIQNTYGYDFYKKNIQNYFKKELGDEFVGYRLTTKKDADKYLQGDSSAFKPTSFSLDPKQALQFANFANPRFMNQKTMNPRDDLVLIESPIRTESIVMRGRPDELEIVSDTTYTSANELRVYDPRTGKVLFEPKMGPLKDTDPLNFGGKRIKKVKDRFNQGGQSVIPQRRADYTQETSKPFVDAVTKGLQLITPKDQTLEQIEKNKQLRSLSTAQALKGTKFEEYAGQPDLPSFVVQSPGIKERLDAAGYERQSAFEGASRIMDFMAGDEKRAFEKLSAGQKLDQSDIAAVAMTPLLALDAIGLGALATRLGRLGFKKIDDVLKSSSKDPDVLRIQSAFGGSPVPLIQDAAKGPPGMQTTPRVALAAEDGTGAGASSLYKEAPPEKNNQAYGSWKRETTKTYLDELRKQAGDPNLKFDKSVIVKDLTELFKSLGVPPEKFVSKRNKNTFFDRVFTLRNKKGEDLKPFEQYFFKDQGGGTTPTFFKKFSDENPDMVGTPTYKYLTSMVKKFEEENGFKPTSVQIAKYIQRTGDDEAKSFFAIRDTATGTKKGETGQVNAVIDQNRKQGTEGVNDLLQPAKSQEIARYIDTKSKSDSFFKSQYDVAIANLNETDSKFQTIKNSYNTLVKEFLDDQGNPPFTYTQFTKYLRENNLIPQRLLSLEQVSYSPSIKASKDVTNAKNTVSSMLISSDDSIKYKNFAIGLGIDDDMFRFLQHKYRSLVEDTDTKTLIPADKYIEQYVKPYKGATKEETIANLEKAYPEFKTTWQPMEDQFKVYEDYLNVKMEELEASGKYTEEQLNKIRTSLSPNRSHNFEVKRANLQDRMINASAAGQFIQIQPVYINNSLQPIYDNLLRRIFDNLESAPNINTLKDSKIKNIELSKNRQDYSGVNTSVNDYKQLFPDKSKHNQYDYLNYLYTQANDQMKDKGIVSYQVFDPKNKNIIEGYDVKKGQLGDFLVVGSEGTYTPQQYIDRALKQLDTEGLPGFVNPQNPKSILRFKKRGGVQMAIGGQNFTENINQQQFTPDPAIDGDSAFKQAVESGNLTALNIPKIFKGLGEAFGVYTPKKVGKPFTDEMSAVTPVEKSDFPLQSFTLEKIQGSQTNQAKPQDWINELQGGKNVAPSSELLDSGLFQYLADYEKYFPGQRISKAKLLQVLEENPISNLKVRIKGAETGDPAYDTYMGRPRHQNAGQARIDEAGEDYREVIIEAGTLPGQKSGEEFVNSTHFSEKNVLAFGRVGTYKNSQGDNVAVIQEMQTDYLTRVRNEQERLDAEIKLLTNKGNKAEQKLATATTEYERQDANNVLADVQSKLPKLLKLKESNLIKPYPNIAAQELIPGFNKQLQDLQKQINDLSMQGVRRENPEFLMQINRLEGEQKQVLDALLDLNRAGGYELLAKDVKVPDISNRDDLINYSEGLTSYAGMKEVTTFAPTPLNKQTDYVDAIIKAVIKDAENRDINKITIMPADIGPNTRWGKDSEEAKKKFRNLYDKVGIQTLRNIAKKYGGEVNVEQIIDTTKAKKGAKFLNKNVDGEFELLRDLEVRAGLPPEDVDDFLNTEIERIALDYAGNNLNEVVLRREIAPGQTMEYYVKIKEDDGFELIPLREGERAEDATIIIEEYNPSKVDMFVLTLPETNKQAPMYLFKKKKGGIMGDDRLVSITDIYGDY